jgi:hypothetical protein
MMVFLKRDDDVLGKFASHHHSSLFYVLNLAAVLGEK